MNKILAELLHYAVVYGVLLYSWLPVMNYFKGDVYYTASVVFLIFFMTDQLAHKHILDEDYLWE